MPRIAAAAAVLATLAAAAPAGPPPCIGETTLTGRAACLGARADALLLAMETALARLAAGPAAAETALADGIDRAQSRWREEMERGCATLTAPDRARARLARARCRLGAAERRRWRLGATLGSLRPAEGGLHPEIEIRVPTRPPGGPARPWRRDPG